MFPVSLIAILALAGAETALPPAAQPTPAARPTSAALPSLALELDPARPLESASWAPVQGTSRGDKPFGFAAIGAHLIEGDVSSPTDDDPDYHGAISFDLGIYTWTGDLGFAVEAGYIGYSYDIDVSALESESVDVTQYLLGFRFVDDEPESPFLYHLRGGLVHRKDDGDVIDDDGQGFYLGGGLEWKFAPSLSLGPQVLYIDTDSADSQEWYFGLEAAFAF